jgi:SRSO17 transposase
MTPEQIEGLGPAFANYLQQFDLCCDYPQTFRLLGVYCKGLLSDLARKSAEPIALASGVAVRTLQEFLRDHLWSHQQARDVLRRDVIAALARVPADPSGTVGIIDETSVVKKGAKTPGVQRQWCGAAGKVENCIVTVHLGVARGRYQTLVDAELFLPQSWANDRARCREADIPDEMGHRPKWRIALGQILDARLAGLELDWLTFDEGYGGKPGFLDGLDLLGLSYSGEVPCNFSCFTREPAEGESGHRADDLARHGPAFHRQPWQEVALARQTLGEQAWQARMADVYVQRASGGVARRSLLVARNEQSGEVKYFICGGREASLAERLRAGFTRYNVEHGFRVAKSELGFGHFEGRSYTGLMRHMTLCGVVLGFVAKQAASLRGGKCGGDGGAGVPGAGAAVPAVGAAAARGDGGGGALAGPDGAVLPEAEPGRTRIAPTPGRWPAARAATTTETPQAKTKTNPKHIVAL